MDTYLPPSAEQNPRSMHLPFARPAYLTTRAAGDMRRDGPGRVEFLRRTGIDPASLAVAGQVHSKRVAMVPAGEAQEQTSLGERFHPDVDGLITIRDDLILTVTVADCMPIFVYDYESGARALLHSGWRGTGILETAVIAMQDEFGSKVSDLLVMLGPCISAANYEVDAERATLFESEWGPASVREEGGRVYLDLRAANQEICRRLEIERVNTVMECTVSNDRLGSFRRQGSRDYTLMLALCAGQTEWELTDD